MKTNLWRIAGMIAGMSLLLAACAPVATTGPLSQEEPPTAQPQTASSAESGSTTTSSGETTATSPGAMAQEGEPMMVEGQMPGAETAGSMPGGVPGEMPAADWLTYFDESYGFQIQYPALFRVDRLGPEAFPREKTPALAGVRFVNPQDPAGELAVALLQIAVFDNQPQLSLDEWLAANKITGGETGPVVEPFNNGQVSGLRIVSRSFKAPGVSVYVAQGNFIFRLTPMGAEGEAMLLTFAF